MRGRRSTVRLEIAVEEESLSKVIQQLEAIPRNITAPVRRAVASAAMIVHAETIKKLVQPGTGTKRGKHTASAPGYPPASDTGFGRATVAWRISSSGFSAVVGTNTAYMAYLEEGVDPFTGRTRTGTSYDHPGIASRPWLGISLNDTRERIVKLISNAVRRVLGKKK